MIKNCYICQKHLERYLTSDELVHHLNENKQDNRIENLELMNRSEHAREHGIKRGGLNGCAIN